MREIVLNSGVRRWHGSDFLDLQKETLVPLQKFFEGVGACVISGCNVTFSGGTYTVQAGYAAVQHADGMKIVAVPTTNMGFGATYPFFISVNKTVENKLYDDLASKPSVNVYVGVVSATTPGSGLYLEITASSAIKFSDIVGAKDIWHYVGSSGGEPTFQNSLNNAVGSVTTPASSVATKLRYKKTSDGFLQLSGLLDFTPFGASGTTTSTIKAVFTLPTGYRPLRNIGFEVAILDGGNSQGWFILWFEIIASSGVVQCRVTTVPAGYAVTDIAAITDWAEGNKSFIDQRIALTN